MQENNTGTWLARDGDGRVLEVDAGGYPAAEASPGDNRPAAEPAEPGTLHSRLAAARAEFNDRTARLGPPAADYWGVWGSAERDWEAEAG
jgi:hypothetical protein